MKTKTISFINLAETHRELSGELIAAITPLIRSAAFVGGAPVDQFEEQFAAIMNVPFAVGVKSGTAAIHLALQGLGVKPGDEVIVPAFTFIATAAPVALLGATPVFVDVDPRTACLEIERVEQAITPKTKVILPVHLYGHPADMDPLLNLARQHNISVLEDCAQSHLATYKGTVTGGIGDVGAYSFYPTKNLGAAGDGGACVTRDKTIAQRIRSLSNHGRTDHMNHGHLGWNERLDALQAAMLTVKLRHLERWTQERREAAARYHSLLEGASPLGASLHLPHAQDGCGHVYHLYVTRHPKRNQLAAALKELGIGTAMHYPVTIPHQPAFNTPGSWPEAEAWADSCLALPLYPGIAPDDQEYIAEAIRRLA